MTVRVVLIILIAAFGALLFIRSIHAGMGVRSLAFDSPLPPPATPLAYLPAILRTCCHYWSRNYYMDTVNETRLYNLGQQECEKTPYGEDIVVVLDFGPPIRIGSSYGTQLFHTRTPVTTQQIYDAVVDYLRGFHVCKSATGDQEYHLTISIGTNNNDDLGGLIREHGQAWADLVNDVNDWIESPPSWAQWLTARGGIDIELSPPFAGPVATREWIAGYISAWQVGTSFYYDYGTCEDCPTTIGAQCPQMHQGWTCEDVWYIAWGAAPALPLPLIYNNQGINAEQWRWLSWYAWRYHSSCMSIKGSFTQWQICLVDPGAPGCSGADQPPWVGWSQLFEKLNAYTMTAQTPYELRWATDISRTWSLISND